jgi:two-component sensor histidine kinase
MLGWPGSQLAAVEVLGILVTNALEHGVTPGVTQELHARLSVTETRELLIEVTDPNPTFRDFERAVAGELGQGLWQVRQLGASIDWSTDRDSSCKTVRATMRPGQVDL